MFNKGMRNTRLLVICLYVLRSSKLERRSIQCKHKICLVRSD